MPLPPTARLRLTRFLTVTLVALTAALAGPPADAQAAVTSFSAAAGVSAVRYAASEKGRPYTRGGVTHARGFDCSGLVTFVYNTRLARRLPRTTDAQYRASAAVAKRSMRPGDLVFFTSGGRAYHVGIYAGHNKMWHAPKPGDKVKLVTLWTTRWVGRRPR